MTNNVLDISYLEMDYAEVGDTKIYIVPVVAPNLILGKSKGEAVDNFKQILCSTKLVQSFDVTINPKDDNEPFKIFADHEYCVTDFASLQNIKEEKYDDCNFGLRLYIPSENAYQLKVINNDILNASNMPDFGTANMSKDLNFETLVPLRDAIIEQIQQKNHNNHAVNDEEAQATTIPHNVEHSDIKLLKNNLYNTLNSLIDKIYLDDEKLQFNSIIKDKDYDEKVLPTYQKLEQLTEDDFNQAKSDKLNTLQKKREDIINSIYNQLVADLWSKNIEADTLKNYKSADSTYHNDYIAIEQKLADALSVIPSTVATHAQQLEEQFEQDKQSRADKARRDMEDKIEREERPLLNNKIQELETTLTTKANQSYNNQIKVLHAEVQNNYELQISKIVDDVIHRHQQTIDDKKAELQQLMDHDVASLIQKRSDDVDHLRQEISKLEQDIIHNETTFNERLELAVEKRMNDYELKDAQMTDEINFLRVEIEKIKRENSDKNEAIRAKEMELKNNRAQLDRLNQQLEQSNQTSLSISAQALEIKQQALSFAQKENSQPVLSRVVSTQNGDLNHLLGDDAELAKRYERSKKPSFFTWLGGLFLCAVLGTGTLFGSHVANAKDTAHQEQPKVEQSAKKEIDKKK
ncbi:hypothetical protein K2V75_04480 [Staphylococcus gallinarum]|uniref:hypothetical protein n=1 Tax=Staphylococcus gallinarum TaxID=1293 RepID=UPI001E6203C2|nr:hypothetical protein [Staphylococcus gallinarum]MCD8909390.1 hypothetical protein [Staphylococcus gallinarum]